MRCFRNYRDTYKDTVTVRRAALGVEVPGHRQQQLTVRLLKTHFFTQILGCVKSRQIRIELMTRPDKVEEKSFASYRSRHKLTYPINVGRNVAREAATTHFVFASDIELYPSPGLISRFLEMVRSSNNQHSRAVSSNPNPRVYVNTIFEIKVCK